MLNSVLKKCRRSFLLMLVLAIFTSGLLGSTDVSAHTEQEYPAQVQIWPHENYLTLYVTGNNADLNDFASQNAHIETDEPTNSKAIAFSQRDAANRYVESHLYLEQDGQILPLHAQSLDSDMEGQFEMFLRVERPVRLTIAPLNVSSDLFSGLVNAKTVVQLADRQNTLSGKQVFAISADNTFSSLGSDLTDYFWSGLLHPLAAANRILVRIALIVAALSISKSRLFLTAGGFVAMHSLTFICAARQAPPLPIFWIDAGFNGCIALLGALIWVLAKKPSFFSWSISWTPVVLAAVGGVCSGLAGIPNLKRWGWPESGFALCLCAFCLGVALTLGVSATGLRIVLAHYERKFTHQAQYGGMNWSGAMQIGGLMGVGLGIFWMLKNFNP